MFHVKFYHLVLSWNNRKTYQHKAWLHLKPPLKQSTKANQRKEFILKFLAVITQLVNVLYFLTVTTHMNKKSLIAFL